MPQTKVVPIHKDVFLNKARSLSLVIYDHVRMLSIHPRSMRMPL